MDEEELRVALHFFSSNLKFEFRIKVLLNFARNCNAKELAPVAFQNFHEFCDISKDI